MKKLISFFVFILFPVFTFAQISGDKIIGSNQPAPYNSLKNAVAHINAVGVNGPVRFLLNDANYNTATGEVFPIKINQFAGSSATNTLTIKPNATKTVNITSHKINDWTPSFAAFHFDASTNIIIDGSNMVGGTSKDLTIINAETIEYSARTCIWISSNGNNGASNINISNVKFIFQNPTNQPTKLAVGIFSGSNQIGVDQNDKSLNFPATAVNSKLTFSNNEFTNVRQGIIIKGGENALKSKNITISANVFGSTNNAQKLTSPIIVSNSDIVNIFDNNIDGIRKSDGAGSNVLSAIQMENSSNYNIKRNVINNLVTLFDQAASGISIKGQDLNGVISENKISNVRRTVQGGNIIAGINIESTNTNSKLVIANNFISTISNIGHNEYSPGAYGLYINGKDIKIYHNTILMNASFVGISAAAHFENGTGFDVQNNVFVNSNSTAGVQRLAIYSKVQESSFTSINSNDYFAPKIGYLGGERTSLNDWKAATGKDQNSISVNPVFVSTLDLHLQSVPGNSLLDNTGADLFASVPADIDGVARTTTPDMGAAEFSAVPIVVPTVPASALTVETASVATGLTVNMAPGNGANRLVLIHSNSAVNAIPVDGVTYNANPTFGAGSQIGQGNYVAYAGSGTSATITGLSECTKYYMAVYEYNGTGTNTKYLCNVPAMAAVGESTTFENGTWSKGMPNNYTEAIIESNYTLPASMTACKLTIRNNANVIVPANYDVILNGPLVVESGSEFKMASNTNLIQETDVQNSGVISVERQSSSLFRLDYTMWGSPVIGSQTLKQFSPQTVDSRFYIYNSLTDVFNTVSPVTAFTSGKGYLIRMPDNHTPFVVGATNTPTAWTGTFVGTPTNGDVSVNLESGLNGFNMLSNPYASMIDVKKFLTDNSAAIEGTIYFWRRRNAVPDASAYYATYTYAGGTSVPSSTTSASGSETPNGFIQVGQGFIVKKKTSATTNTAIFNNSMRTQTEQTNQFFKNSTAENSGRVWLNVTNAAGEFGQTLIAYLPEADNEVDFTDGKYLNDGTTALTSWLDNSEYIIQGRAPFTNSDVVALNFKTATAGTYTIAVDKVDGLFEGTQAVFLRDNLTGVLHDLKGSVYTFATQAGSFNKRFDVVYQNPLSVENSTFDSSSIVLFKKGNNLVINSGNVTLDFVEVYDLRGRLLALAKNINANEISINVEETNQMLIVKITSTDGISITKKTIN